MPLSSIQIAACVVWSFLLGMVFHFMAVSHLFDQLPMEEWVALLLFWAIINKAAMNLHM